MIKIAEVKPKLEKKGIQIDEVIKLINKTKSLDGAARELTKEKIGTILDKILKAIHALEIYVSRLPVFFEEEVKMTREEEKEFQDWLKKHGKEVYQDSTLVAEQRAVQKLEGEKQTPILHLKNYYKTEWKSLIELRKLANDLKGKLGAPNIPIDVLIDTIDKSQKEQERIAKGMTLASKTIGPEIQKFETIKERETRIIEEMHKREDRIERIGATTEKLVNAIDKTKIAIDSIPKVTPAIANQKWKDRAETIRKRIIKWDFTNEQKLKLAHEYNTKIITPIIQKIKTTSKMFTDEEIKRDCPWLKLLTNADLMLKEEAVAGVKTPPVHEARKAA